MSAKGYLIIREDRKISKIKTPEIPPPALTPPLVKSENDASDDGRKSINNSTPDLRLISSQESFSRTGKDKRAQIRKDSAVSIVNDLTALFQRNDDDFQLRDVTVILVKDNKQIQTSIHSSVLKSRSNFFKDVINSFENRDSDFVQKLKVKGLECDIRRGKNLQIIFKNIEIKPFQEMIKFMYTAKIRINNELKIDLFKYACHFGVTSLERITKDHLLQKDTQLTIPEAIDLIKFINKTGVFTELKKKCILFLKSKNKDLIEIAEWEDFCSDYPELVAEILRDIRE